MLIVFRWSTKKKNYKNDDLCRIEAIKFRAMKVKSALLVLFGVVVSASAVFEIRLPVGCPAAMNCTDIRFCGLDGFISKTPVDVSPERELYRMPLSDCRDPSINLDNGKCCRDPDYVDPWPSSTYRSIGRVVTPAATTTTRPNNVITEEITTKVKRDCTYPAQRKYVSMWAGDVID